MQQTNLYTITIQPLITSLTSFLGILDKAIAYAETKKLSWMSFEEALLHDSIVFDQFDFIRQVQVASDNAKGIAARLAEVEIPAFEDTEKSFDELKTRVQKTIDFLNTIKPEQIVGKEDVRVTLSYFPGKYLTGFDYATQYGLPNFYFHLVTAYDILRKNGVPLGKADFMNPPFNEEH